MVKKVLRKKIKAGRLIVSYKMHLVTAVGKGFTQLGGNNPASAEAWVTNYSYFHLCDIGNETTRLLLMRVIGNMPLVVSLLQV